MSFLNWSDYMYTYINMLYSNAASKWEAILNTFFILGDHGSDIAYKNSVVRSGNTSIIVIVQMSALVLNM